MALNQLAATFGVSISATVGKLDEMIQLSGSISETWNGVFNLGPAANQGDSLYSDEGSLANPAGTITLNFLAAGALEDKLGETIDWDILKAIVIRNTSIDATLEIGGTGAGQMALFAANTETLILQPGGRMVFIAADVNGLDISANASLKLTHGGEGADPVVYEIIALGVQS